MVQSLSNQSQNPYGAINKVGMTPDGRVVYEVMTGDGRVAGGISVAQKDCDTFERSYNDIMEAAPKLEKYMQTHTEDDLKKQQKKGKWIIGGCALIGGLIPALFSHKITNWGGKDRGWLQAILTGVGTLTGLVIGGKIGTKAITPPGAEQLNRATETISKLDIQAVR